MDESKAAARWRAYAALAFPKELVAIEPGDAPGEPPKRFGTASRIVPSEQTLPDGTRVALRKWTGQPLAGFDAQAEPAELLVEVTAASAGEALERSQPIFERIIDRLAFDLQEAVPIAHVDFIDVTGSPELGEQREFMTFTSSPIDKFAASIPLGQVVSVRLPQLQSEYPEREPHVASALRWYVKALGAPFLHDQFIFLWIALESFADRSGVQVTERYTAPCGHVIATCPECGTPTSKVVRGASLRSYLTRHNVDADLAGKAWKLRQMMHGAVAFDSRLLDDLPRVVEHLRAIVATELKIAVGMPREIPPVVTVGGWSVGPAFGLGGVRQITERDLN
jgi:hypothetical protein